MFRSRLKASNGIIWIYINKQENMQICHKIDCKCISKIYFQIWGRIKKLTEYESAKDPNMVYEQDVKGL